MIKILHLKIFILLIAAIQVVSTTIQAQGYPEMNFQNPVLESGIYGADGSTYRFDTICPGVDAVVEITGRSSIDVMLSNIDTVGPGLGYDKAFQPVLGIPGTAPANSTWWMDFKIYFYIAGSNTPITTTQFYASGIDIDGDGLTINEWAEMYKIESIDSAVVNSLTFTQLGPYFQGYDYRVEGIIANSPGIDTSAKNVMATYRYAVKSQIQFRIGATTAANTSTAAMRLNSIWFRDIYVGFPLAVKLTSFSAIRNQNKVELAWSTASQDNTDYFVIEESKDGSNFIEKDKVFIKTTNNENTIYHSFQDLRTYNVSYVYYRIRLVDKEGKSTYSQIRIINCAIQSKILPHLIIFPNPVQNELRVTIPESWQNEKVVFELSGINGTVIFNTVTSNSSQTETLNIRNLAPGVYILRASSNGEVVQQKIIKH